MTFPGVLLMNLSQNSLRIFCGSPADSLLEVEAGTSTGIGCAFISSDRGQLQTRPAMKS